MKWYSIYDVDTLYPYVSVYDVEDGFGCSREVAERAIEYAFQLACELMMEDIEGLMEKYGVDWKIERGTLYAALDGDDEETETKLDELSRAVEGMAKFYMSKEFVMEHIEVNKWYMPCSREYNFYQKDNGESVVLPEIVQDAVEYAAAKYGVEPELITGFLEQ
jgi:hypothetical protein